MILLKMIQIIIFFLPLQISSGSTPPKLLLFPKLKKKKQDKKIKKK